MLLNQKVSKRLCACYLTRQLGKRLRACHSSKGSREFTPRMLFDKIPEEIALPQPRLRFEQVCQFTPLQWVRADVRFKSFAQ